MKIISKLVLTLGVIALYPMFLTYWLATRTPFVKILPGVLRDNIESSNK